MKKLKFLFILPIFLVPFFFSSSANAVVGSYYADEVRLTHANNSTTVFNTWTASGRSQAFTNSSSTSTNFSINSITIKNNTLSEGITISPYQSLRLRFSLYAVFGPDSAVSSSPIFSCPNRVANISNAQITDCQMEKNVYPYNFLQDDSTPTELNLNTGAMVYEVAYDVVVTYLRTSNSTSDLTVPLSGPFLSYIPTSGKLISITFSRPVMYLFEDPSYAGIIQNGKDNQDRNNIETQQENNEDDAEDTKDEANTTGTTLMGAFSALITALGNVHSTNCKLPNMQVYTLQLKNMDLCTVNMPSGISALGGIAVSLLIVKLGISLVKRMLALYKEIIG